VSGLSEPLLAMLLLGSFLCYLKYRDGEADSWRWLAGSILLFTLGAFAKETAIVFPVIVLACEWPGASQAKAEHDSAATESRSSFKTLKTGFLRALPFGMVALVYLAVRYAVLKGFGHTTTPLSFATIVYTWPSVLWAYIKALIWPFGLSPFYDTPYVSQPTFVNFFLPLAGLLIVIAGLVWVARRSAAARVAALWLVLPILPLCNLAVFPEGEIVHDRYLYLPSVGFAILAALALTRIRLGGPSFLRQPSGVVAASAGVALILGAATLVQQSHWKSNFSLFSFSALVAPNNSIVANNLGNEFVARGEFDRAIEIYQRVLENKPTFWLANYNLGYSYYKLDRLDEAERYLTRATEIKRSDPDQYVYLGLTQMKAGRLSEAATNIRRAIERKPDAFGYHFALGSVLKKSGDLEGALEQFKAELVNNPRQTAAVQQIADIEARLNNGGNEQVKNLAPASPSR
ncbi:MAG TPA: tetratricopeptide repeat protein, partial [Blastocatellia bacterium]|nr:tetratricopeptide repeat protein [Blastocatellia bacterium]